MRRFAGLFFVLLLLTAPIDSAVSRTPSQPSTEQRIHDLEIEQRQMSEHLAEHTNDLASRQGEQDARISQNAESIKTLQERQAVVYAIGKGLAWAIALIVPGIGTFSIWIGNRRYIEAKERHKYIKETLTSLDKDITEIKISCAAKGCADVSTS